MGVKDTGLRGHGRRLGAALATRVEALALATVGVNVLIVITGGVVRLTGSGLGCPTWPRCTEESFTPHGAIEFHSAIEFGNRLVTFLIAAVAILTLVAVWSTGRRHLRWVAVTLALGVPAQAVLGGITVLTDLNPWIVAFHLLVSLAMICLAVLLLHDVRQPDGPVEPAVHAGLRALALAIFVAGWVVLYLGTVVTGSGPHAGDINAPRNGLDPRAWSQLHTDAVFLFVGLTVALVLVLRGLEGHERLRRAAGVLLAVQLGQGAIGFVQYFTGLPVVLVALHLLGAALTAAAMTSVVLATRHRRVVGSAHP